MTTQMLAPPAALPGDAPRLAAHDRSRMIAGAGPVYPEFGHRFGADALIVRSDAVPT